MGLSYNVYLNSDRIFGCKGCKTHLANQDSIISRNFCGVHGKAYLFANVVNITRGEPTDRSMTTGKHRVSDIFCKGCGSLVGWTYIKAWEPVEKYKEGKFILEYKLMLIVH